jgi:hypothetical protein
VEEQPTPTNPAPAPAPTPTPAPVEPEKVIAKTNRNLLFALAVMIIAGGIFAVVVSQSNSSDNGLDLDSDAIVEEIFNDDLEEYRSVQFNFKIDFPGFHIQDETSVTVEGIEVPATFYQVEGETVNELYQVSVGDYSVLETTFSEEDIRASLEGAANGIVRAFDDGKLISADFIEFRGGEWIEASFSVNFEGELIEGYIRATIEDEKQYALYGFGISEAKFQRFANSFEFIN